MGLSNKIETNVNLLKSEAQSTGRVILHVDMWLINSYYWVPLNGPKLTHHYLFIFFSSLFCFFTGQVWRTSSWSQEERDVHFF